MHGSNKSGFGKGRNTQTDMDWFHRKKVSFLFNQNARPVSQDDHTRYVGAIHGEFLGKNWKGGTSYNSTMVVATYPTLGSSEKHRLKSAGLKEDMLVPSRVHSKKKSEFQSQ